MVQRVLWLLFWLASLQGFAQDQHLKKLYTIKFDPAGGLFNEFRISYERRVTAKKYFFGSASYFYRQAKIKGAAPRKNSTFNELLNEFLQNPENKFIFTSAGYFYRDDEMDREKLFGPVVRVGMRQYFKTKNSPEGPFVYAGLSYGLITGHYFDENYQLSDRLLIHKPGVGAAGGYQWILGMYKNFAVDVFGGMEYYYVVRNADTSQRNFFKNINNFNLYCGAQIGFAFRQRDRHW